MKNNGQKSQALPPTHLEIPDFIIELLKQRGITGKNNVSSFLYPQLKNLPIPPLMKNLEVAAALILEHIADQNQIVIWGDYDVDGTTGTALLVNFFKEIGIEVKWHIPGRLTEGYGLNTAWFRDNISTFKSKRFLLITVDSGVSNAEEIQYIKDLGGQVIVTDHHVIPESGLPECIVLNPEQASCKLKKEKLAGVGVAFYLVAGLRAAMSTDNRLQHLVKDLNLKSFLGFVALGTVSDMVELTTTNRILVRAGTEVMDSPKFRGLQALLHSSDIFGTEISSEDIGFLIGPKINAAGRLGDSRVVVELFTTDDDVEIKTKIKKLERLNQKRKDLCKEGADTAFSEIRRQDTGKNKSCVVYGDYHLGVAGIVASKLVEFSKLPSIVLAEQHAAGGKKIYKGSGRSVDGINLIAALSKCSSAIEKFGGHEMAVGLTVAENQLDNFLKLFTKEIQSQFENRKIEQTIGPDIECSVENVMNEKSLHYLSLLEPFGRHNPQPKFYDRSVQIIHAKTVGHGADHLNMTIRGVYSNHKGIGFGLGEKISDVQEEPNRSLIFTPTKNRFRGTVSWQVRVLSL